MFLRDLSEVYFFRSYNNIVIKFLSKIFRNGVNIQYFRGGTADHLAMLLGS